MWRRPDGREHSLCVATSREESLEGYRGRHLEVCCMSGRQRLASSPLLAPKSANSTKQWNAGAKNRAQQTTQRRHGRQGCHMWTWKLRIVSISRDYSGIRWDAGWLPQANTRETRLVLVPNKQPHSPLALSAAYRLGFRAGGKTHACRLFDVPGITQTGACKQGRVCQTHRQINRGIQQLEAVNITARGCSPQTGRCQIHSYKYSVMNPVTDGLVWDWTWRLYYAVCYTRRLSSVNPASTASST